MRRVDGEEDSALTWGDLYGRRSKLRNPACESRLNVQKSADAVLRKAVATACGRAEHEIGIEYLGVQGWAVKAENP
jgi:hypothetical protein